MLNVCVLAAEKLRITLWESTQLYTAKKQLAADMRISTFYTQGYTSSIPAVLHSVFLLNASVRHWLSTLSTPPTISTTN